MVELNRAVAIAEAGDVAAALALLEGLPTGALEDYHYLHATRAQLLRRLDRDQQALASYRRALALVVDERERRLLRARMSELEHNAR